MNLRQFVDKHRNVVTVAMAVLIAGSCAWAYVSLSPPKAPPVVKSFYFIDEGKSAFEDCFAAPRDTVPPFDHEGKQAVRARVFEQNGRPALLFLERMTKDGKKGLEARKAGPAGASGSSGGMPVDVAMRMSFAQMQVKKPDDKDWVGLMDKRSAQIIRPPVDAEGNNATELFPKQ